MTLASHVAPRHTRKPCWLARRAGLSRGFSYGSVCLETYGLSGCGCSYSSIAHFCKLRRNKLHWDSFNYRSESTRGPFLRWFRNPLNYSGTQCVAWRAKLAAGASGCNSPLQIEAPIDFTGSWVPMLPFVPLKAPLYLSGLINIQPLLCH